MTQYGTPSRRVASRRSTFAATVCGRRQLELHATLAHAHLRVRQKRLLAACAAAGQLRREQLHLVGAAPLQQRRHAARAQPLVGVDVFFVACVGEAHDTHAGRRLARFAPARRESRHVLVPPRRATHRSSPGNQRANSFASGGGYLRGACANRRRQARRALPPREARLQRLRKGRRGRGVLRATRKRTCATSAGAAAAHASAPPAWKKARMRASVHASAASVGGSGQNGSSSASDAMSSRRQSASSSAGAMEAEAGGDGESEWALSEKANRQTRGHNGQPCADVAHAHISCASDAAKAQAGCARRWRKRLGRGGC